MFGGRDVPAFWEQPHLKPDLIASSSTIWAHSRAAKTVALYYCTAFITNIRECGSLDVRAKATYTDSVFR